MLTDNPKHKHWVRTRKRPVNAKITHWSDSQKIDCVTTFITLGSIAQTAAVTRIPESTVKVWRNTEWWKELERELRNSEKLVLSSRLKTVVERSLDIVADRLQNGDFIYNQKSGEIIRKPVNVKEAAHIANTFIEQRERLEGNENYTVDKENIATKLDKLKQEFKNIVERNKQPEVTDVIFVGEDDAVHEEREERLQERE